ncbi:uncharacterized protein LOC128732472 [Sabethes cyaneus]|uniref:uncharacterized protein LOC128732472 n=1 Tax=Sabethes cyaneus TaxID=53552 RepID=UPI00237E6F09|nr:uncharacterized protein LOC128732472 [Sabethes cyaneus]
MDHVDDQCSQLDAYAEHIEDIGARKITQGPELISDRNFARLCVVPCGLEELTAVLQSLLARFSAAGSDQQTNSSDPSGSYQRGSLLREIISEVIGRVEEFRTLEQYLWLVKFSCALALLKNVPAGIAFETNRVIRTVAGLNTEEYEFDPLKIHIIAKSLFEDIPLDGMNLIHVIKKLAVLNQKLLYYVSIALLFAGIQRYTGAAGGSKDSPVSKMYRLHSFDDMLAHLQAVKIDDLQQKLDIRRFFLLLKLLSLYQNAVLLRHSAASRRELDEQHCCFGEFFRVRIDQKQSYLQWLRTARNVASSRNSKSSKIADREDFLLVIELIDLDMIPLIEDDIGDD